MGFGKKPDYPTARTLDLDKTYRSIIKPAVEACGLLCVRADELRHSGFIDAPMYEWLLSADLVIADLSTLNPNTFYELGVRHALRPCTTLVIAERHLTYPFDVSHVRIEPYTHLGDAIDWEEAMRVQDVIKQFIREVLPAQEVDSPVYTFLKDLQAPSVPSPPRPTRMRGWVPARGAAFAADSSIAAMLAEAEADLEKGEYRTAKERLHAVHAMKGVDEPRTANDDYVMQRLVIAVYKSGDPTPRAALEEAARLLLALQPLTSLDAETIRLWSEIQNKLWEMTRQRLHLDASIDASERIAALTGDVGDAVDLAFRLTIRAAMSAGDEQVADVVRAMRIREQVIAVSTERLSVIGDGSGRRIKERYRLLAARAEAQLGLKDEAGFAASADQLRNLAVDSELKERTHHRLSMLRNLLRTV